MSLVGVLLYFSSHLTPSPTLSSQTRDEDFDPNMNIASLTRDQILGPNVNITSRKWLYICQNVLRGIIPWRICRVLRISFLDIHLVL